MWSDERIFSEVFDRLAIHHEIDCSDIEVSVQDGIVSIRGFVDSSSTKLATEYLIASLPGVQDVENLLQINKDMENSIERSMSGQDNLILKEDL